MSRRSPASGDEWAGGEEGRRTEPGLAAFCDQTKATEAAILREGNR